MMTTALRPYQAEAVEAGMQHPGFALIPEQRTGKTLVSLALVDKRKPDVMFVVCPKKAIVEWRKQIKKHLAFDWKCQKVIINYEDCTRTQGGRAHYRALFKKWKKKGIKVYLIVDEAHRIKKRGSLQSKFLRSVGKLCEWRLALTGTPIAQGIQDAWAIFDLILPGVLGTFEVFAARFLIFDRTFGPYSTKVKKTINETEFYETFHKYSFRLTFREAKKSMGLPVAKIRRKKVLFELKPKTWEHYLELEEDLETYVKGHTVSTPIVLTLIMKLQQLCGGYLIKDERVPGKRQKKRTIIPMGLEKLAQLRKLLESGEVRDKFVVCCRFKHEIKAIGRLLEELDLSYKIVAGGSEWDAEFDTDAVILQIQSGVAIDLSAARNYVFYSWDYSYINYEQSKFRILSFETVQANYWYLIAENTVDMDIYRAVMEKKNLADLVCDKYRRDTRVQSSIETSRGNKGRAQKAHP